MLANVLLGVPRNDRIDRDIVRSIVEEPGRGSNPYSDLDTLIGKLATLKPQLAALARTEDGFTTYWAVKDDAGIHTSRQGQVLGLLGWHEDEIGNPPLPALVQRKNEPMVNDGYFVMVEKARGLTNDIPGTESEREALWREHVRRVRSEWRGTN